MLRISKELSLPLEFVTQRNALLAMSGAGKSNAAVAIAEEMFRAGLPWIAIDPKGDWWGLRSSRDGKSPGLPIPILGGLHGDVPLDPTSGIVIGEMIAAGELTGILDVSEFDSDADQARFLTDIAVTLLRKNSTPLHIFAEEADTYLPQNPEGVFAKCVGAWKKICTRGRQRGIGVTLISQRSAHLNKSALNQAETLIAMRVNGPLDRKAIEGWLLDAATDATEAKRTAGELSAFADGEAWVWSPHRLKLKQRIRFRQRETFDSGKTPEIGIRRAPPTLADLDIAGLSARLAATVEQAKADDPKALRARITELEDELEQAKFNAESPEDVPIFNEDFVAELRSGIDQSLSDVQNELEGFLERRLLQHLRAEFQAIKDASPGKPWPPQPAIERPLRASATSKVPVPKAKTGGAQLGKCARSILAALAQHGDLSLTQAAMIAGYAPDSGGVRNAAGELRAGGFVEGSNAKLRITAAGKQETRGLPTLPTGAALLQFWVEKLGRAEGLILQQVRRAHPRACSLEQAAKGAGYEPSSGGVRNAAGKLRTLELVRGGNSGMQINEKLL